jgi:hypothetical protein
MINEPIYPVGIQDFANIRERNAVYVDKTDLIYRLTHTSKYVFLSRPRRFGKSLLSSTLQYYFEGRRDLFAGLAMDGLETEWTVYPVLHFDLSTAKQETVEKMEAVISLQLKAYEELYGRDKEEETIGSRLNGLIRRAYQKNEPERVLQPAEGLRPLSALCVHHGHIHLLPVGHLQYAEQLGRHIQLKQLCHDLRYYAR